MSARRPLNVAGVLLSELPADYSIPQDGVNAPQVAYLCGGAARAADYFGKVNGVTGADARPLEHAVLYTSPVNPNVRHIVSELPFSAQEAVRAWDMLFCKARRWSNDTYGTYQKRTDFTARGFVAHVNDPGLGVNEGFAHTWYEYVPPRLRGSKEKAPLVFYLRHRLRAAVRRGAERLARYRRQGKLYRRISQAPPATRRGTSGMSRACPATRPLCWRCWSI